MKGRFELHSGLAGGVSVINSEGGDFLGGIICFGLMSRTKDERGNSCAPPLSKMHKKRNKKECISSLEKFKCLKVQTNLE